MSRTLLSPLPLGKCASHISCALPAMNRPLLAELKFRENTESFKLIIKASGILRSDENFPRPMIF